MNSSTVTVKCFKESFYFEAASIFVSDIFIGLCFYFSCCPHIFNRLTTFKWILLHERKLHLFLGGGRYVPGSSNSSASAGFGADPFTGKKLRRKNMPQSVETHLIVSMEQCTSKVHKKK